MLSLQVAFGMSRLSPLASVVFAFSLHFILAIKTLCFSHI